MDRDLVERVRRGDREAFAVLVHQVSDSLYAVAYRILHIDWVRGYCGGQTTLFGTGLEGDTLKFFDQPDDCGGDSWTMTRAGTGSAPTAPPAPAP